MIKQTVFALAIFGMTASLATPAHAQAVMQSQARTGTFGNASRATNNYRRADSVFTKTQRLASVRMTGLGGLAQINGPTGRNGLPQTSLDSFVLNAGGAAEMIYGDEGSSGPPPYNEFTKGHRIQTGIQGARAAGLTTGHGSYLPDAWGGDEFVDGPEFTQSAGRGSGNTWSVQAPADGQSGERDDMTGEPYQPQPPQPPTDDDQQQNQGQFDTSGF